jgi:hypothetical protein
MMRKILMTGFAAMSVAASLQGQSFTNLNFESAQVTFAATNNGYYYINTENALPGWSAFSGTNQFSLVQYDPSFAGPPEAITEVGLFDSNSIEVIGGNFSVFLKQNSSSISQTGLVPMGSESLLFDAVSHSSFMVLLDGDNLSYTPISSGTNTYGLIYTVYAADISAFAGQVGTLTFSGPMTLDNIQFSPEAIPEPSLSWLLFLGGGVLFYFRQRRQLIGHETSLFHSDGTHAVPPAI